VPAKLDLATISVPSAAQVDPLYSSVHVTSAGFDPPKANASFCVPAPAKPALATISVPPAAQVAPPTYPPATSCTIIVHTVLSKPVPTLNDGSSVPSGLRRIAPLGIVPTAMILSEMQVDVVVAVYSSVHAVLVEDTNPPIAKAAF